MSPCPLVQRGQGSSLWPMRSKPPAEAPPPNTWTNIRQLHSTSSFPSFLRCRPISLPSQQPLRRLLSQHRGRRHAAIAEPQVLHDVASRSKGDAHRRGDDADVILPARRLLEGGDELSLRTRRARRRQRAAGSSSGLRRRSSSTFWLYGISMDTSTSCGRRMVFL